eukprot:GHVU01083258.1.p1 GENE.GHVU01083258.1~~GHVU01083258.1.p1  ORF type:complete len:300 (-),score=24.39 GHVU01083258.1:80-979(-)
MLCTALLDSGASLSTISTYLIEKMKMEGTDIDIQTLEKPTYFLLATGDDIIHATKKVILDVHIQCEMKLLTLKAVEFLILMDTRPTLLLGIPVLMQLGINPVQMIKAVCVKHGLDLTAAPLGTNETSISVTATAGTDTQGRSLIPGSEEAPLAIGMLQNAPQRQNSSSSDNRSTAPTEDPFDQATIEEDGDELGLRQFQDIGDEDQREVLRKVQERMATAFRQGNVEDREFVRRYQTLISDNISSFRLRLLTTDPPANVPPMQVRLRPNARPVRTRPRRYGRNLDEVIDTWAGCLLEAM